MPVTRIAQRELECMSCHRTIKKDDEYIIYLHPRGGGVGPMCMECAAKLPKY